MEIHSKLFLFELNNRLHLEGRRFTCTLENSDPVFINLIKE